MVKLLRRIFFLLSLAFALPVHAAEPLLMFLFGIVKEVASSSSSSAFAAAAPERAEAPQTYPGTTVPPATLRRLIEESFTYLSQAQRAEIFEALHAELLKPANITLSAPLIEHFAARAAQVREAQARLAHLTGQERERLLEDFRAETRTLSEHDLGQLRSVLERGLLPVPSDLTQQLLGALG
jgi:hypothetical protein